MRTAIIKVLMTSILLPWLISVSILVLTGPTFAQTAARIPLATSALHFAAIGDYGSYGLEEASVSTLVHSWNPDLIITTGDNNYNSGGAATIDENIGQYYHDYIYPYIGSYGQGAPYNKFFPALGNHDWDTPGAQPYLDYFTLPANERYYDFVAGPVHFFAIDSDQREPNGNTSASPQAQWLQSRLAAATEPWKLVYFHHPPYSSCSVHGSTPQLQWPFQQWGATAVLSGHDHTYERLSINNFPYFVDGLGGRSIYQFSTPLPGSLLRYNDDYGAMLIDATTDAITFRFISRTGILADAYTINGSLTPTPTSNDTPTPTSTDTPIPTDTETPTPTPTPIPQLTGHVTWQGRPAQPSPLQQLPITLTLKLGAIEINYPARLTDSSGYFTVSTAGLPPGLYNWRVKNPKYLANAGVVQLQVARLKVEDYNFIRATASSQSLTFNLQPSTSHQPSTFLDMGLMRVGDCNNDNMVNTQDFNILKATFGKSVGQPGYDDRAEFTGDQQVNIADFILVKFNFGASGAPPLHPAQGIAPTKKPTSPTAT